MQTKRDFFDIDEFIESGHVVQGGLAIIVADRNIGKSTGTVWKWLKNADNDNQVMIIRNTEKELDKLKSSIKNKFNKEIVVSASGEIWRQRQEVYINKKTEEETVRWVKDSIIGFMASLSGTIDSERSSDYPKVKYIVCDEFNQWKNGLNAAKFLELMATVVRHREDVMTVLLGNRIDIASDIIVELQINPLLPEDFEGNYIQEIKTPMPGFEGKFWYIDIDEKNYTLNNGKKTAWQALGSLTRLADFYGSRGWMYYDNLDCKKLTPSELKKVDWKFSLYDNQEYFIVGVLDDLMIIHFDKEMLFAGKGIMTYGDPLDSYRHKSVLDWKQHAGIILGNMRNYMQKDDLIYTSVYCKEEFNKILDWIIPHDENRFEL